MASTVLPGDELGFTISRKSGAIETGILSATSSSVKERVGSKTVNGAILPSTGLVLLGGTGARAMTLVDPAAADDGARLTIAAVTAQAHTVSNAAGSGFNGGGGGSDVGTYGGAVGDRFSLVAIGGVWYVDINVNVTLA